MNNLSYNKDLSYNKEVKLVLKEVLNQTRTARNTIMSLDKYEYKLITLEDVLIKEIELMFLQGYICTSNIYLHLLQKHGMIPPRI